jgi:hypothetical protein
LNFFTKNLPDEKNVIVISTVYRNTDEDEIMRVQAWFGERVIKVNFMLQCFKKGKATNL